MSGTKPKREWIPLERLVREPGLQMRSALPDGLTHPATVERYYEAILESEAFPPLEVVSDGKTNWLFDGFQRAAALERAGKASAECLVYGGSRLDALLHAIAANARHGLTRTMGDCRRSLFALLDEPELLQRVLARATESGGIHRALAAACGVSKSLVNKVFEERNLRVVGGKLVKKRAVAAATAAASAAEAESRGAAILKSSVDPANGSPSPLPHGETPSGTAVNPTATPASLPVPEPEPSHDIQRARNALASLWTACRHLLDGPLGAHLVRCARNHGVPFVRQGNPEIPLSADALWEPVSKIEAVLSDLTAIVYGGVDQPK